MESIQSPKNVLFRKYDELIKRDANNRDTRIGLLDVFIIVSFLKAT